MWSSNSTIPDLMLTTVLLALSATAPAQSVLPGGSGGIVGQDPDDSGRVVEAGNGSVRNADLDITARVVTDRDIVFAGDPLQIGVAFSRGADRINDRQADAFLVIFAPTDPATTARDIDESTLLPANEDDQDQGPAGATDLGPGSRDILADAIIVPLANASGNTQTLFSIDAVDVGTLTAGTYQLGVVLTDPGGNPLNMNDWYNGLLGLVDVVGLTITAEALPIDADGDGQIDNDFDNDGFVDRDSGASQSTADESGESGNSGSGSTGSITGAGN